jgi:hypothetical protein
MFEKVTITKDKDYKPSSPEEPSKRFLIETDEFRWVVHVVRYVIKETDTPVFYARTDEGYSAYGLTENETLNDLKAIMLRKLEANPGKVRAVSLDEVKNYLDPLDAAREEIKLANALSSKTFLARLLGL